MTNKTIPLSISLKPIKVDMIVDADKVVVDQLIDEYKYTPKDSWGGGIGDQRYFQEIWEGLNDGYEHFLSNPEQITHKNQGWIEFCNDCLRCAVLYSVMTGYDLELVDISIKRKWLEAFLAKTKKVAEQELLQVSI